MDCEGDNPTIRFKFVVELLAELPFRLKVH